MLALMDPPTGQQCSEAAMAALHGGDVQAAVAWFERAGERFLAEGKPGSARSALSNTGQLRKQLGDLRGALRALGEAVRLIDRDTPMQERGMTLLVLAGIMDRLADPREREAWSDAS